MEEHTIFDAMEAFDRLSEAVIFTANEIALFHALLYSWNTARRPAVIQQWANKTSQKAGLSSGKSLSYTRNSLVQKGVIYFYKSGNRGVPQYSLNAVFGLPEPDWLLSPEAGKVSVKAQLSVSKVAVNCQSYKEKEKEKGKEQAGVSCVQPSGSDLETEIRNLQPAWSKPLTYLEQTALFQNREAFASFPFQTVRDWLATGPEKPPVNRLSFLETAGQSAEARAEQWLKTNPQTDGWRSEAERVAREIAGLAYGQNPVLDRLARFVAKGKITEQQALQTWKEQAA